MTEIVQQTIRVRTTVLPGGRVEILHPGLREGEQVDVVITPEQTARSALQIISEGPEQRLFSTAREVDDHIAEKRASWDRRTDEVGN